MPRPIFDTKDAIPKGFEDEYEEREGKWHPKAEDGGLKTALEEERRARKAAEKLATKAADERADLERKLSAASASGDDKEKDRVAKALAKFDTDLADAKAEHKKELDAARAELRTLKLDEKVKDAFIKAGGRPERADKALRDTHDRFDLADDGRILVKDAKGDVTSTTVEDFFGKTYRGEMAEFYTGTKATGGGATGGASARTSTSKAGVWSGDVIADPMGALRAANANDAAA